MCQRDVYNLVICVIRICPYINSSRNNLTHRIYLDTILVNSGWILPSERIIIYKLKCGFSH